MGASGQSWLYGTVYDIPGSARGASFARGLVRRALESCDTDIVETVELLVSEVFTNALTHAASAPTLQIDTGLECEAVRVTVSDSSPQGPTVTTHSLDAEGGRGMQLVDALSRTWGWEPTVAGKRVWFIV